MLLEVRREDIATVNKSSLLAGRRGFARIGDGLFEKAVLALAVAIPAVVGLILYEMVNAAQLPIARFG
ncbi:MAG: hypothetical protein M1389_11905, partial [Chloroflexi bacterium]|nr:hypothetical protein [Chloroflexota bacterium]